MNWRAFTFLLIGACLVSWTFTEFAEARGGGRGGGGRGGGSGFSSRSNYGSIRNSARPSTRDISRPSTRDISRPSTRDISRPSAGDLARPSQQPVQGGDRLSQGLPSQLPATGIAARPSQLPSSNVNRGKDLTVSQKDQLRQEFQNSGGLKPTQLPVFGEGGNRPGHGPGDGDRPWDDNREDWQDWMDHNREDWQDWYHHQYNDHWDDHWYSPWWYGYPVSTVSYSFYIDDTPPCQKTVLINQATGSSTYYYCNAMWYQPAYSAGEVKYIVTAPPAGAELSSLTDPYKVTVGGQDYYVSNHVFYQKITRDGQALYVTVDPPPGARLPSIPEYAVEIEHQEQRYFRFDKIFYVRQGDFFVVVKNPGV